jgi:selenide, water dikinase
MALSSGIPHQLVLVGAGHSHVEVLRDWAQDPLPGVRVTVVSEGPRTVYSGMVPGFVAGQYRLDEIEIDAERLARRAGAAWIDGRVTGFDAQSHMIHLQGAPSLDYATVSFDVGSTVAGLELPGVRLRGVSTRPIGDFARGLDSLIERARRGVATRFVVVGAGAGGVELAFAIRARLERLGARDASVVLLESGPRALPGYPDSAMRRIERNASRSAIEIRCDSTVVEAQADRLVLEGGESLDCDGFVWVAGSASLPLFDGAGVERDGRGFVVVRPTLQAVGHDEVFAAGDCASLVADPALPKAGVYAVREGPVLAHNLKARVAGRPLRTYRPQRSFLSLLNLGTGRAIAVKWGVSAEGAWAWRLKDAIDRSFVRRYR